MGNEKITAAELAQYHYILGKKSDDTSERLKRFKEVLEKVRSGAIDQEVRKDTILGRLHARYGVARTFTTAEAATAIGYSVSYTRDLLHRHEGVFWGLRLSKFNHYRPVRWQVQHA